MYNTSKTLHVRPENCYSWGAYLDCHVVLKNGLIPGISHLVAPGKRHQLIPLAVLMWHSPLSKADANITGHIFYAVGRHTQAALEGHQQRPCMQCKGKAPCLAALCNASSNDAEEHTKCNSKPRCARHCQQQDMPQHDLMCTERKGEADLRVQLWCSLGC